MITIILSIDGNIGSGKSTYIQYLKEKYKNDKSICFLKEPVDEWNNIKDKNGKSILENFYEDQNKYAFSFQIMAYISRLSLLREALKKNYKIIITERSVETDRYVFAKMLYHDNLIEKINYEIYLKWFNEFLDDIPEINYIYIHSDPKIALERVLKRNRKGENIPLQYLSKCHSYHEDWMGTINNKIVINGNIDDKDDKYNDNLNIIEEYINNIIQ